MPRDGAQQVRFAFCKRDETLDAAAERLRKLRIRSRFERSAGVPPAVARASCPRSKIVISNGATNSAVG